MLRRLRICVCLVGVFVCAVAGEARADCSGSGVTWTCTAGTTSAQVNTALASATDGATLTFDTGTYSWGAPDYLAFSTSKAATLVCATAEQCDVTVVGHMWRTVTGGGSSTKLWRISGFEFVMGTGDIFFYPCNSECASDFTYLVRIDHNRFTIAAGNAQVMSTEGTSQIQIKGVMDHNTLVAADPSANLFNFVNALLSEPTARIATENNFFFEDNVLQATADGNAGITDGWGPVGVVIRFNDILNFRIVTHGADHVYGWDNFEVYRNQVEANASGGQPDCFRTGFHHQGSGQMMIFGNTFTCSGGYSASIMNLLHYRGFDNVSPGMDVVTDVCSGNHMIDGNRTPVGTYRGYPCYHQPGRDFAGNLYPIGVWQNTRSDTGAKINLVISDCSLTCVTPNATVEYTDEHLVNDRDYFNAVSKDAQTSASAPFDGTTGMGFGTLANRPKTCTTTTESGDAGRGGVLYWATDQGSWNTESSADHANHGSDHALGEDGVLYVCSATDTWSTYYTPSPYPHSLATGGGGGEGGSGGGAVYRLRVRLRAAMEQGVSPLAVMLFLLTRLRRA